MLLHVVPGQPACLNSPSPHKLPPTRGLGLSAPERNAGSQVPLRPRELRVIGTSLPTSCLAAACRLRRSCHRHRVPVALPRSGCPVRRSRHPAAIAQSLLPPLPAAFCGRVPRLRRSPRPQKRRATFKQQPVTNLQTRTPTPRTPSTACCPLLDPAYTLRINQQGVRFAHVHLFTPLRRRPPGAGRVAFHCGARLARVERL